MRIEGGLTIDERRERVVEAPAESLPNSAQRRWS
jgi:hypothetical protein